MAEETNDKKSNKPSHFVYRVVDKGDNKDPFWLQIGAAFTNRDGSLSVIMDAIPPDGRIQIRQRKEQTA